MSNIYDDVELLQSEVETLKTQMTTVESQIAALQIQSLAANTDLNTLGVGRYIVPNTVAAASLVNKPDTAGTAFINVVSAGSSGQLVQYYFPCVKEDASYYQRCYHSESWGDWNEINLFDSGWLDLTLSGNVIAFNDEQKPRYRRIGKEVFITGVVKNISANETLIGTLPVNYRPSKKIIVAVPSTGTKFSRISVHTNGNIYFEQSSDNAIAVSNWVSVACNFNVAD